jgi:hypothetical protein
MVQAGYHGGAALYDGVTGDRDGAVSHGAQAAMGVAGALPGVSDALGGVDRIMGLTGGAARVMQGHNGKPGEGVEPGDIPASVSDVVSSAAVGATNAIFGKDDSNWFADGKDPTGSRAGEIKAGMIGANMIGSAALGPLGLLAAPFVGSQQADAITGLFGSDTKPGSTSGAGGSGAATVGQKINKDLGGQGGGAIGGALLGGLALGPMGMLGGAGIGSALGLMDEKYDLSPPSQADVAKAMPFVAPGQPVPGGGGGAAAGPGGGSQGVGPTSDGAPHGGMPIPLNPDGSTPGHGAAYGPNGGSSFSPGPGSYGSPGKPLGPADAQGSIRSPHEDQLVGPGGLPPKPLGPEDAQGQITPNGPMPYGVQPKLGPQGPMPYGIQPKGNGAPMGGPMPTLPWFLQPAGPSTW